MDRVIYCPGSVLLEASLPNVDTGDEESARGSRIHRAFETGNPLELNEEENEAYQAGWKFTDLLINRWKDDRNIISQQEGPRELRLWYNHPETLDPLGSAQLDRHYIAPPDALIVDLKSGWATHVPPATKSWQLRFQALCLFRDRDDIKRIRVSFARALSKVGANDFCDYEESDLKYAEQSMLFHLWEASQKDAYRRPGEWCRYCKAAMAGACREAAAYSMLPSVIAGKALAIESKEDAEKAVAVMTLPDLCKIWSASGVINKIISAVFKRLKSMTPEQLAEVGLELGPGRDNSKITDVVGAYRFLNEVQKWDAKELWAAMNLSKTEIARIARREKNLSSDEKARVWVKTALAEFITPDTTEPIIRKL